LVGPKAPENPAKANEADEHATGVQVRCGGEQQEALMVALRKETFEFLAEEAEVRAAGDADIWVKEQWQYIAAAYRELAQKILAPTTNVAGQIEATKGDEQWTIH
jgi:hypothetical protein